MSYTDVFGGSTIYPSQVSYINLALDSDLVLEWPLQRSGDLPPASRIIDVTPTGNGFSIVMPDATETSPGQTLLFNNLSGSYSFTVKNAAGGTLATVNFGTQWQIYLSDVSTVAGTWRVFRYGASTATVQPSQIAGYGLLPTGATLSQSMPVTTVSSTPTTLSATNRAGAFVWIGSGAGTIELPLVGGVGNNYFVAIRNEGGGDLTVDPAGSETIDGGATLVMRPGYSAIIATDGIEWFTFGYGQQAVFAFDYTAIALTGGTYTLAGSELNRISYKFTGALSSDVTVVVPATVQQYWVTNDTTGPYNLFLQTPLGTPVQVNQGAKGIYYSNGTDVVLASDPVSIAVPLTIDQGGTGAVTASAARLSLGITTLGNAIVTATSGATVLTAIGGAASGVNNDITELTGLTTPISPTQGGTGGTDPASARTALDVPSTTGSGASGTWGIDISGNAATATSATTLSGTVAVANGGTGSTTAGGARTNLSAQETLVSGTNIKTVNGNSLLGSGNIDVSTAPFPSGTRMLFQQSAAPTGWTKDVSNNNKALRVVSGTAGSGGSVDFTTAFANQSVSGTTGSSSPGGTIGGTALTTSQLPSHSHYVIANGTDSSETALTSSNQVVRASLNGDTSRYALYGISASASIGNSSSVGSGGTHTHTFTGAPHTHSFSSSVNLAVAYLDVIVAQVD